MKQNETTKPNQTKDKKRNKLSVHMKEFLLISRAVALFTGWLRQVFVRL